MENMFDTLAKTTVTKKEKKNNKPIIKIPGDEFDVNLNEFVKLKKELDDTKTKFTLVQSYIKDETIKRWFTLYNDNGSYPGSVLVTSDSESSFMFSPSDKYITIDDERAKELIEKYGENIITKNIKFSFNSHLLEKYGGILSDLIQKSNDISDDDKKNLIVADKTLNISKGSIEKALTTGNGNVEEFMSDIQPVFSLRTPKLK